MKPSGWRSSTRHGGSAPCETNATERCNVTGGVGGTNPAVPGAQRIIAMQAMSQEGSCGQSSSQQGIEAIATSAVKAVAGCEITGAKNATARKSGKSRHNALPMRSNLLKSVTSANGFVVNVARCSRCNPLQCFRGRGAVLSPVPPMRTHDIRSFTLVSLSDLQATDCTPSILAKKFRVHSLGRRYLRVLGPVASLQSR